MLKMKALSSIVIVLGLFALTSLILPARSDANGGVDEYTLEFIPTQNAASPGQIGLMRIRVNRDRGETIVHFSLRGGYPNTVYTIWIVFNVLKWPLPTSGTSVPSCPATGGNTNGCPTEPRHDDLHGDFPKEGNGVSPLARLDKGFTDGMGLDHGAVFVTNNRGDGEIQVVLDYDLIREAPVGNKAIITQNVKVTNCVVAPCEFKVNITTTWLRRYIGEYVVSERSSMCANYDPSFDPDVTPPQNIKPIGTDARYWQCVDPATVKDPNDPDTGLPRVPRFTFDHFRLAPHPDDLTHGLIGGTGVDHFIDMVGRRCDVQPSVCP